ncbi:MAG TPA: hypothetical protein VGL02_14815 [Streptomyces sp.]
MPAEPIHLRMPEIWGIRLTAMDRHVIANMGATTAVFPSDEQVRAVLRAERREDDFVEMLADADATSTSPTRSICPQ